MSMRTRALSLVVTLALLTPALTILPAGLPAGAAAKEKVSIVLSSASVKLGQTAHIKGKVTPAASRKAIRLQRFYGNAWHGYKSQKLTTKSTYDFGVKMTKAGAYKFRVASPHAFSKAVTLTVVRPPTPPPPGGPKAPR